MTTPKAVRMSATLTDHQALTLAYALIGAVKGGADYCQISAAATDRFDVSGRATVVVGMDVNAKPVFRTTFETAAGMTHDFTPPLEDCPRCGRPGAAKLWHGTIDGGECM